MAQPRTPDKPPDIPPSSVDNTPWPPEGFAPDLIPVHWAGSQAEIYNMLNPDPPASGETPNPEPAPEPQPEPLPVPPPPPPPAP